MTGFEVTVPTLALVLRHVSATLEIDAADVIRNQGEGVDLARPLYCWLAEHVTDRTPAAIALSIGVDPDHFKRLRNLVDARRKTDQPFRERLDDVALEIHVEAGLMKRNLVAGAPDRDAAATARRLLTGPRRGVSVPTIDLVHLAASYELLAGKVAELDRAIAALRSAQYGAGEKGARQNQERVIRELLATIQQPAKVPAHG